MVARRLINTKYMLNKGEGMNSCKQTEFINELANIMDKYDVHFVVEEFMDESPDIYIVQNDWTPVIMDYEWKTGKITSNAIRKIKFN